MRKYMITALFALVFAVPGMAKETPMLANSETAIALQALADNPEMDPELIEAILRAGAEECQYTYSELNDMYNTGLVGIDKIPEGYRVYDDGGMILVLMEDDL